jgi:ubiquinone/menaquinone biosynthesis C-methylase UbiE
MTKPDNYGEYASIAELYDYIVPYHERADVGFFVEAATQAGGPVLEVGCGTGRVLIPTARAGVEITGLDLSQHMLAVCREHLKTEPEEVRSRIRLVEGDMRQFEIQKSFKLVTLPFRPFQHLTTVEDQLACLDCIRRHLETGGKIILDIFNPSLKSLANQPTGEEMAEEPEFSMPDGRRVVRRHMVAERDLFNQIIHSELVYYITHPDGRKERLVQAFPMRYFFKFEGEHLLARAGFGVEQVYADYDKSPYGSKYPGELIFVARKA